MRHNVESFTDLIVLGKNWGCGAEGARLLGMEKVGGSIPPSSTNHKVGSINHLLGLFVIICILIF